MGAHGLRVKGQRDLNDPKGFSLQLIKTLEGPRSRREVGSIVSIIERKHYDIKNRSRFNSNSLNYEVILVDIDKAHVECIVYIFIKRREIREVKG
jgi:hypothetical protein